MFADATPTIQHNYNFLPVLLQQAHYRRQQTQLPQIQFQEMDVADRDSQPHIPDDQQRRLHLYLQYNECSSDPPGLKQGFALHTHYHPTS